MSDMLMRVWDTFAYSVDIVECLERDILNIYELVFKLKLFVLDTLYNDVLN